jgi:predicted nucleic acid-binding protein
MAKAPVILGALARRVQGRSPEGRSLQGSGREVPVNVLIDTDVLVDLALGRKSNDEPAAHLVDALERRRAFGFLAWHSASNFYYFGGPETRERAARTFLLDLAQFVEVAPTTTESLRQAGRLKLRDFEDAMQVAAAIACGADVIATRNHKDHAGAPIRAAAPGEVLKILT